MSVRPRRRAWLMMVLSVVVAFGPAAAHAATPQTVAPFAIDSMSCPSLTECVAVGHTDDAPGAASVNTQWATFNPQAPAPVASVTAPGYLLLRDVACPSPVLCVASGERSVSVFDPTSTAQPTTTTVLPTGAGTNEHLSGVACPSASQCTAISRTGVAYTFNPASAGAASPAQAVADEDGQPSGKSVAEIACPTVTQCTTDDISGRVATFNPQAPSAATPVKLSDWLLGSIACASPTRCVVRALDDGVAYLIRFDPNAPAPGTPVKLDPYPGEVACPSPALCAATAANLYGFGPTGMAAPHVAMRGPTGTPAPTVLACSAPTQCTAGGNDGRVVTFDPSQVAPGPVLPPAARPTPTSITVKSRKLATLIVAVKGARRGMSVFATLTMKGKKVLPRTVLPVTGDGTTRWSLKLSPGTYVATFKLRKKTIRTIKIRVTHA